MRRIALAAAMFVTSSVAFAQIPFYDGYRQRQQENQLETLRELMILREAQQIQKQAEEQRFRQQRLMLEDQQRELLEQQRQIEDQRRQFERQRALQTPNR